MNQINGAWAYIDNLDYKSGQINIKDYALTNDYLYAETDKYTVDEYEGEYAIWNLKTK